MPLLMFLLLMICQIGSVQNKNCCLFVKDVCKVDTISVCVIYWWWCLLYNVEYCCLAWTYGGTEIGSVCLSVVTGQALITTVIHMSQCWCLSVVVLSCWIMQKRIRLEVLHQLPMYFNMKYIIIIHVFTPLTMYKLHYKWSYTMLILMFHQLTYVQKKKKIKKVIGGSDVCFICIKIVKSNLYRSLLNCCIIDDIGDYIYTNFLPVD